MRGGVGTVVNKLLIPWTSSGSPNIAELLKGGPNPMVGSPILYQYNYRARGGGAFSWGSPKFYDTGRKTLYQYIGPGGGGIFMGVPQIL